MTAQQAHSHQPEYTRSTCGCHDEQEVYCRGCGADLTRGHERPDQPTEPARVAPSREQIAEALKEHDFSRMVCLDHSHFAVACDEKCHGVTDGQYLHHAEIILALLADQPTVEQVKAEARREVYEWIGACVTTVGADPTVEGIWAALSDPANPPFGCAAADRLAGGGSDD